jgi:ATP-binding cassette subfamily B protein
MTNQKKEIDLPKTLGAFFLHFVRKQKVAFIIFFLAPIVMVLENNVIPYSLKMIVDALASYHHQENIYRLVAPALLLGGGAWILMIVVLRLENWWEAYVIPRFLADVRLSVFDYLSKQSYRYFSNQMAGNLANKLNDLPRALNTLFELVTWYIIAAFFSIGVALILMCTINYWFAVILLVWIVIQLLISLKLSKNIDVYSIENAEHKSELSGKIVDSLSNSNAVKLFSRRATEKTYIANSQQQEQRSNTRLSLYMNVFRLYLDLPVTVMLVIMVTVLLYFWQNDQITTGDLVFIFNVSFVIMTQIWYLCHAMADFYREVGVARQAISILSTPIEVNDVLDAKNLIVSKGEIEFKNVTFHYNLGKKIFNNKSIVIQPKQRVGLVGYSGSGKTTFIHLILRLFNLDSGHILIDKQDISQVTQDSLRESIMMIPQDTSLFHRSLMDNIRYGNPAATDQDVIEASIRACCDEFISLLPEGYNTLVGDRGIKLSGGQRQRIAIARAILKNAPILILDEATSQLDSLTEELIHHSLWGLMEEKTTLVIAHRLSTLLDMDRILVFREGQVIEDGTHHTLVAENGLYRSMWEAQIGGFLPEDDKDSDDWDA